MNERQDINGDLTVKRYDAGGQRVTSCCGCYSTYCEVAPAHSAYCDFGTESADVLCCKSCYREVDFGEGDGSEFRPGMSEVDIDLYYKNVFAVDERATEARAFLGSP